MKLGLEEIGGLALSLRSSQGRCCRSLGISRLSVVHEGVVDFTCVVDLHEGIQLSIILSGLATSVVVSPCNERSFPW
jgi:hypothetical protein